MSPAGSSSNGLANKQPLTYVCMSTVDDLSYTPSAEERTRDAAQIAATGRRSWKTLKGKGEAVWPPHLEAALIEALERYQPDDLRSTKIFGRFPMRNRFISNYIFETTGKRRTPKQVGSRLQQLRDTCRGKRLLELISKRGRSSSGCDFQTSSPSPSSDDSLPTTSPPPVRSDTQVQAKRIFIYVDVLPDQAPWPSPFPIVSFKEHGRSPLRIRFTSPPPEYDVSADHSDPIGAQPSTSSLSPYATNPVVTFASPSILHPHASFAAFLDGESSPVHSEVVPLICCASPAQGFEWLYSTTFVPGFWKTLRDCPDPSRYTVVQDITSAHGDPLFPSTSVGNSEDQETTFSVVFRFIRSASTSTPPAPPHFSRRPSEIGIALSPANTDVSVSSFSPPSSSGSLHHAPSHVHQSIDIRQSFELSPDLWPPFAQFPIFSPPDTNRYFDATFCAYPQEYSLLTGPMISKTNRYSTTTSGLALDGGSSQRWVDSPRSSIQSLSSLAVPFPIYPSNYVL